MEYDTRLTDNPTVAQVANRWHAMQTPGWQPQTVKGHRGRLDMHVLPRWGDYPVSSLDPLDISRWINVDMASGLALSTRKLILVTFSAPLNWGMEMGIIESNPVRQVKMPTEHKDVVPVPDTAAILRTIEWAEPLWANLVYLTANTGLRRSEVAGLQWQDVGGSSIVVSRAIGSDGQPKSLKTKRSKRRIAIGPQVVERLNEMYIDRRLACIKANHPRPGSTYVFSNDVLGEKPIHPDNISHWWIANRRDDSIRFHDLRHWAASQMLASGIDAVTVASRLGHDPVVLMRTYAHMIPERDTEAAAVTENILTSQVVPSPPAPEKHLID